VVWVVDSGVVGMGDFIIVEAVFGGRVGSIVDSDIFGSEVFVFSISSTHPENKIIAVRSGIDKKYIDLFILSLNWTLPYHYK
jgi:hypothetical protein